MAFTYNGNNAPEYNQNGDAANGRQGSYTYGGVTNRMQQPQRSNGNPYGDILNFVQAKSIPNGYAGGGNPYGGNTLNTPPVAPGVGQAPQAQPQTPPLTQPQAPPSPFDPAAQAKTRGVGSGNPNPINPRTGKPLAMAVPKGVDPNLWNEVDSWVQGGYAKGADYSFLYQHPQWVMDFRQWQATNDPKGTVDPVDWLAHTHPEVNHQLAGRQGTDTYATWLQAHPQAPPGNTPPPQAPPFKPDLKGYTDTIMQQYGPLFGQQRTDLSNLLAGQGALTGDLNSGGYMDVLGRQENRLAAQQGGQVGDALQQELNRQYQAWAQANNYNLGVAGLGLQQYFHDNPSFNDLMQWYLSLSPEQLSMMGITGIPWQNFVLTH